MTCRALRNVKPEGLVGVLDKLPQQKTIEELEAKVNCLLAKTKELQSQSELKSKKKRPRSP